LQLGDTPWKSDYETTSKWNNTKKIYVDIATKVVGYKTHKECLKHETWKQVADRKQLKAKMLIPIDQGSKTGPLSLRSKDTEVNKSAMSNKRSLAEAERAAARDELSVSVVITPMTSAAPMKGKYGSSITTES